MHCAGDMPDAGLEEESWSRSPSSRLVRS